MEIAAEFGFTRMDYTGKLELDPTQAEYTRKLELDPTHLADMLQQLTREEKPIEF